MYFKTISPTLLLLWGSSSIGLAADVSWCKDNKCTDCPSGLTSAGPGYPECVIYDSDVVFGGQGFKQGPGAIKYLPHGKFGDPCGGQPGSILIRSPASLDVPGCGDLIYHTQEETCSSSPLYIEKSFMVQFCCGSQDCDAVGIPVGKRSSGNLQSRSGGWQTAYLAFGNGTRIEPMAVGSPPVIPSPPRKRQAPPPGCANKGQRGYVEGSFEQAGDRYKRTGETRIVSPTVGPFESDQIYDHRFTATIEHTTTFSITIGDPWGIVSAEFGETWGNSEENSFIAHVPVVKGQIGRIGFTPILECVDGSMERCSGDGGGRTEKNQICRPWRKDENGPIQGDYKLVQTG